MKNAPSPSSVTSTEKSALAIAAAVIAFFCVLAFVAAPARAEPLTPDLAKFNSADGTPLTAWVYRSDSPVSKGSVVALHGCGGLYARMGSRKGLINARSQAMAEMLVEQGYTVIYPDSMGPRGETEVCTERIADRKINLNHRRADALAGCRRADGPGDAGAGAWVGATFAGRAHLRMAHHALASGSTADSLVHVTKGCEYASKLRRPGGATIWKMLDQECLSTRAQLALEQGESVEASVLANRALALARSMKSTDPVGDRYALAKSLLLSGDAYRAAGDTSRARRAWELGLRLTQSTREQPKEIAVRAELLDRTGQRARADQLRRALAERGIRNALLI